MIKIEWPGIKRAPVLTCALCGKKFRYRGVRDSSAVDGAPVWCDECERNAKLREAINAQTDDFGVNIETNAAKKETCAAEKTKTDGGDPDAELSVESVKRRLLDVARAEIGYQECGSNLTKYASAYDLDTRLYGFDMDGSPWCDYFVDWCFMVAFGFDVGSAMTYQYRGCSGAACAESALYYKVAGAFHGTPEIGDQIFFYVSGDINHTGIVEEIGGGYVTTIEGNSSDSVRRNQYRVSDPSIAGYGRPKWKAAAGAKITEPVNGEKKVIILEEDSEFGPLTEERLNEELIRAGETPDGICTERVWKILFEKICRTELRTGDTGSLVTALQAILNYIGGQK